MCGIAGLFIKDKTLIENHHDALERFLDALMLGIADRGKQASGFAAVTREGKVVMDKSPIHASKFIKERESLPEDLHFVIAHTRWATKGDIENYMNNHPVLWGSCFVTHNGSIRNDDELFEKYKFERHAQVDTEILPALLSHSKFETPHKMAELLGEIDGTMAIAAVDPILNPGRIVFAKTYTSPFIYHDNKKFFMWASTYDALKDAWGTVFGTPPNKGSFKELGYRKMIVLGDEGFTEYDIPSRYVSTTYTRAAHPTTAQRSTESTTEDTSRQNPGQIRTLGVEVDLAEVAKRCRKLREKGAGLARAIPLASRIVVGMAGAQCAACDDRYMNEDLIVTMQGTLCLDCSHIRRELIVENSRGDKLKLPIPSDKLDEFNAWTQDDDFVHNLVTIDLAKELGLETAGVEYILFRMTDEESKQIPWMYTFREALREQYDTDYVMQWEKLDEGGFQKAVDLLKKSRVVTPDPKPHGQLALPAGVTVHPGMHANHPLRRLHTVPTSKHTERFTTRNDGSHCECCQKKAKTFICRTITKEMVGFCRAHWRRCFTPGCGKKPVFATSNAVLYCHDCSRGQSPGMALTALEKEGFAVGIGVQDALIGA